MARFGRSFPMPRRLARTPVELQYARPASDVTDGSWLTDTGGANLSSAIDEATPDNSDYIISGSFTIGGSTDTCEIALSDVFAPTDNTGHTVAYRYAKNGGSPSQQIDLRVRLLQGATEIGSWTHLNISNAIRHATQTLTTTEAGNITDYNDLRLEFQATFSTELIATRRAIVYWAEFSVPFAEAAPATQPGYWGIRAA